MKRDNIDLSVIPPDLREAEELLIRYGLWAQDRYKSAAVQQGSIRHRPCRAKSQCPS